MKNSINEIKSSRKIYIHRIDETEPNQSTKSNNVSIILHKYVHNGET